VLSSSTSGAKVPRFGVAMTTPVVGQTDEAAMGATHERQAPVFQSSGRLGVEGSNPFASTIKSKT
jgi:hypothetical protein